MPVITESVIYTVQWLTASHHSRHASRAARAVRLCQRIFRHKSDHSGGKQISARKHNTAGSTGDYNQHMSWTYEYFHNVFLFFKPMKALPGFFFLPSVSHSGLWLLTPQLIQKCLLIDFQVVWGFCSNWELFLCHIWIKTNWKNKMLF